MPNFFQDNDDLLFQFERLDLREVVACLEQDYRQEPKYDGAPQDYAEALENYKSALDLLGRICAERVAPRAQQVDLEGARLVDGRVEYANGTKENIRDLSEAGFMGVIVPRKFGGIAYPATVYMMMIEMLSRADASLMTTFGYQDVGEAIAKYGTADQASEFLLKYSRGEALGAMVMTEPGAGSDLQAIKLRAYQDEGGNWFLNGVKHFISNGNADVLLVVARSEEGSKDMFGLSLFACHAGEQVQINSVEEKMGLHGSPTCELYFDHAPAQLIGKRKSGMIYVLNILNHARFSVASQALGIAECAYREALDYSRARKQFGKALYDMPLVAEMLVEIRTKLDWMRSMVYAGAQWLDLRNALEERIEQLKHEGKPFQAEKIRFDEASKFLNLLSPLTKYVVTEAAVGICYDAQQLHGGMGYMREMTVERLMRDVRITTIYEGASQVQIASCINSVKADVLRTLFDEMAARDYGEDLNELKESLALVRDFFLKCRALMLESGCEFAKGAAVKEVVDTYSYLWIGFLMLEDAKHDERKRFAARRYIRDAVIDSEANFRRLSAGVHSDLEFRDSICQ